MRCIIFVVMVLMACGKNQSGEGQVFSVVSSVDELVGYWKLIGVAFEKRSDAVVISGTQKYRFRADGAYTVELESFSLSTLGQAAFDGCTSYGNGELEFAGDTVLFKIEAAGVLSSGCAGKTAMTVVTFEDTAATLRRDDETLQMIESFTYVDADGVSQEDKLIATYVRVGPDFWRGEGLDFAFSGEWKLAAFYRYVASSCTGEIGPENVSISGERSLIMSGEEYWEEMKAFAYGGGDPCTAQVYGATTQSKLNIDFRSTAVTNQCATAPMTLSDDFVVAHDDRTFATSNDHFVRMTVVTEPDPNCPLETILRHSIEVFDRG